jgi:hypothetical protein
LAKPYQLQTHENSEADRQIAEGNIQHHINAKKEIIRDFFPFLL